MKSPTRKGKITAVRSREEYQRTLNKVVIPYDSEKAEDFVSELFKTIESTGDYDPVVIRDVLNKLFNKHPYEPELYYLTFEKIADLYDKVPKFNFGVENVLLYINGWVYDKLLANIQTCLWDEIGGSKEVCDELKNIVKKIGIKSSGTSKNSSLSGERTMSSNSSRGSRTSKRS